MPIPKYIHENAALFCSLMLVARAGKISVTEMKRRGDERKGELISVEINGKILP